MVVGWIHVMVEGGEVEFWSAVDGLAWGIKTYRTEHSDSFVLAIHDSCFDDGCVVLAILCSTFLRT